MGRLIKIHEIEEFSEVMSIPDAAVNCKIKSNVKLLDEKSELEHFIRKILYDPNRTPHGPTEIADILTTHLHVRGNKCLAAFVLKGKSFQNVQSRGVSHQFLKLRQMKDLGLMVFAAVGNIQDDVQRDFIQVAIDANCDYLMIDSQDLARLLIAYKKICPKDGTPYNDTGACREGHYLDKGLSIEMEVREKPKPNIVNLKDVSYAGAKRYSANILIDKHYSKDVIRKIIQEETEKIKYSNYYRNSIVKKHWGKRTAQVVWLHIALTLEDINTSNWICQTCWIDPSLENNWRPQDLKGNEKLGDIEILWNDNYIQYRDFFEGFHGSKEKLINVTYPLLEKMREIFEAIYSLFKKYCDGNIQENDFISKMQKLEPKINEIYDKSGEIPLPPADCKDFYEACKICFADFDNFSLYYSKKGLEIWSKSNRDWLMQENLKRFLKEMEAVNFEEKKLH